ncbi:hypothetical protein NKH18_48745 [Streptomyces sp. M10(2022)]
MSGQARKWAWESSASRGTARLVLLSIADRIPDEQCVAYAGLTELMERTHASRNAVRGALTSLAEAGDLEICADFEGPSTARCTACRARCLAREGRGCPEGQPRAARRGRRTTGGHRTRSRPGQPGRGAAAQAPHLPQDRV